MGQKLGQHFLKDRQKIKKIVSALEVQPEDTIIEIGPGHGELTKELVQCPDVKVIAIEKDRKLVQKLKENFQFPISNFQTNPNAQNPKLQIIKGDALETLPPLIRNLKLEIRNSSYKIAGNIPYYITGRFLRTVGELEKKPKLTILTVQKEVALRICARPPRMNLLAASVQCWAEPEIIDFIPKKEFRPRPKVDSAIIRLETRLAGEKIDKNYYRLIKAAFKQPRKTVFNNLKAANFASEAKLLTLLRKNNISESARPQNLSLETLKKLAIMLYNE